ncbi:site-2 protease family protein [Streptomyces sp. DSM 44915]|uniref:Zinc metalloprotease n=1 Tax=Streptomyces chisholmiae TaxID=3075540 RepID=A0ABU2JL28_9ACTN|nr:site-2 protease family protein [Streptomyces sp. DSM 44915]MDT0265670.1 site-2 protease family protein [Streptomyces sp. DSM 44915]
MSEVRATFTLGRIAGVRVGVHWSVVVIFAVIALGLGVERLPNAYPDRSAVSYTLLALLAGVLFLASLLAHELAHAVVARKSGVPVRDIVLWLLGGATRTRTEAPDPEAEFRIAGAGPATSLALGVVCTAVTWLLVALDAGPVVEVVAWLAVINFLLALFNAFPAAPLDGGRLLRAALWRRSGDRPRATAQSSVAGQVFGWVLVAAGLVVFLWSGAFGALWLALVGWFVAGAASLEGQQARVRQLLAGVPVTETMTPRPATVPADATVGGLLSETSPGYDHPALPVVSSSGAPIGLVTRERLRQVPVEKHRALTVAEIMVPLERVRTTTPDQDLAELLPRLEPGPEQRVLVVEGAEEPGPAGGGRAAPTRLLGIVSPSDVNRTIRRLSEHPRHQPAGH